ncbi:MAG: 4-(cytidine 5'-diphospho)-2-C-methyl-D-erythritol kinase [Flavobacteriales bacterium]|nr:4-(cytidine 5'-diphospho)-2-C-methyl-D-erythritol kinase [Flavobacteriales bacterium]
MIAYPNAKVNLGLNILSRRPDGYHDIESVFVPVQWRDMLEVVEDAENAKGTVTFTSTGIAVPDDGKANLCERAYLLLHQRHGLPAVRIHLHKLVPIGAGLGGGSADAAFTLRLIDRIFALGETDAQLEHLAAQLGSDCPFFIRNTPQLVTGRGETMRPVHLHLAGMHILLIHPNIHIGTAEAYSGVTPKVPSTPLQRIVEQPVEHWRDALHNDFEDSLFRRHPLLGRLKAQLYAAGAVYASMTGSGSSVYGLFAERKDVPVPEGMQHRWMEL